MVSLSRARHVRVLPTVDLVAALPTLTVVAIGVIGLAVRVARVGHGLPYPLFYDEPTVINAALRIMATGDWQPETFRYGSLPIYLSVVASSVGFLLEAPHAARTVAEFTAIPPSPVWYVATLTNAPSAYLATRLLFAVIGALTALTTMALAWTLGASRAAWLAGALVAVAPLTVVTSSRVNVDGVAALWTTLAIVAGARVAQGAPGLRWAVLVGAACGVAAATKVSVAVVAVIVPIAVALRRGERARTATAAVLALLGGFVVGQPFTFAALPTVLTDLAAEARHYGAVGDPSRLPVTGWEMVGRTIAQTATGPAIDGVGVIAGALALVGASWLVARRPALALVVAAFPVAYLALLSRQVLYFERNVTTLVPVAAALAAVGLSWSMRWLPNRGRTRVIVPAVVAFVVLLGPTVSAVHDTIAMGSFVDTRVQAARWLADHQASGCVAVMSDLPFSPIGLAPSVTLVTVGSAEQAIATPCVRTLLTTRPAPTPLPAVIEFAGRDYGAPPFSRPVISPNVIVYRVQ